MFRAKLNPNYVVWLVRRSLGGHRAPPTTSVTKIAASFRTSLIAILRYPATSAKTRPQPPHPSLKSTGRWRFCVRQSVFHVVKEWPPLAPSCRPQRRHIGTHPPRQTDGRLASSGSLAPEEAAKSKAAWTPSFAKGPHAPRGRRLLSRGSNAGHRPRLHLACGAAGLVQFIGQDARTGREAWPPAPMAFGRLP
jgi:hypothetical protein